MTSAPDAPQSAVGEVDELASYDLRLRSLDRQPEEPICLCSTCGEVASWSVWLHTPEWGRNGGATYVLCLTHALAALIKEAHRG